VPVSTDEIPPDALTERPEGAGGELATAPIRDRFVAKLDEVNAAAALSPIASAVFQAALSIAGPFGAAISGAMSGRAAQLAQKNSTQLFLAIRDAIRQIDETKIDRQFLESDEFTSLLIDIYTMNAKTYEEEKIDLFSRIFINSALGDQVTTPYKEGFVKIIGELSVNHIKAFQVICERTKNPDPNDAKTAGRVLASEIATATGLPEQSHR